MNQPLPATTEPTGIQVIIPDIKEGEIYIGAFINADGTGHHTILLPGDYDDAPWKEHMNRAAADNADLPNRAELVTMYEQFPDQFQKTWYWSNTTHERNAEWAWYQLFDNGGQSYNYEDDELRARAVRRLPI